MNTQTALSTVVKEFDFSALEVADLAPSTKIKYQRAWIRAINAGVDLTDVDSVIDYARTLPNSARLHLSAMMRIQVEAAARRLKTSVDPEDATPEIVAKIQVALWHLEDLQKAIPTQQDQGKKMHLWLSQDQVDEITSLPFQIPGMKRHQAMRDYIVLATLLGAGPRREEMSEITFESLRQVPAGKKIKNVLEIDGKGGKTRVVLVSPLLAKHLREWKQITGGGRIARSINKAGKIGRSLSEFGIFGIVRKYGAMIGLPQLDPHDCRRTYGRLIYEQTKDVMLVRDLLGHQDVKTTMRYIGLDLNLEVDPDEFVIREKPLTVFMAVSGD